MDVRVDATSFVHASRTLKTAAPDIRKELLAGVRFAANKLRDDLRNSVKSLDSQAKYSGGHVKRGALLLKGHKGTSAAVLKASGLAAKAAGRSGLRATIARNTRSIAKDSGTASQVGVRVAVQGMPADQRKLPRHMDQGSWRHPVMGDRDIWVTQTVTPSGWWSDTVKEYGPEVRKHIDREVNDAMNKLAAKLS